MYHALAPFVRSLRGSVIITCGPENGALRRTIEKLGAIFINGVAVLPDDPQFQGGSRRKRRYRWTP